MGNKFNFTIRGSYNVEGTPGEVADFVAEYASNRGVLASKRKLDLNHFKTLDAIEILRIKDSIAHIPITEAYAIEGTFQRENVQRAAENLGHNSHLIAVVLSYQSEKTASEVIPFSLNIRDEDII